MLSLDFIREHKDEVLAAARNKNRVIDMDGILREDDLRRSLIVEVQTLRQERNVQSKGAFTEEKKIRGKEIKEKLKDLETRLAESETKLNVLLLQVPNVPLEEVPIGKDETGNVEVSRHGDIPEFDFEPVSHIDLGLALDILDLERGVKVSGFRGYFLKNEGALLQMAVLFHAFRKLTQKGYTPLIAPAIVKGFTLFGNGQFPWGEDEVYKLNEEDAYLAGTAEVPVTAYYSGEILAEKDLPRKFVAFSPCFRREAGAYGKDTRGIYRLHEFWKVEQVIIAKNDVAEARALHEELQQNTEDLLKDLGLPYRRLLMCTGDMGEPQIKKFDTEIWMPSRKAYGEIASNSIMGDFQTRRLRIKYRKKDGSTDYCYSLNDTAIPSPRILIAILENFQKKDGTVVVPEVLRNLTGFTEIRKK